MTQQGIVELGAIAANTSAELSSRIAAVALVGNSTDHAAIPMLKSLFTTKIDTRESIVNWDPSAAQRVVELYAIAALHQLGDDLELGRIPGLVADGGRVLQGPDGERRNAVTVISQIGSVAVIRDLITTAQNMDQQAAEKVVAVLDLLHLPEAPVRQDLGKFAGAQLAVTGVTTSLRELIDLITSVAKKSVQISPGVEERIASGTGTTGKTVLQGAKLPYLLQEFLPDFGLDYFVEVRRVVICTSRESAEQWNEWWIGNGARLRHSPETQRFVLT